MGALKSLPMQVAVQRSANDSSHSCRQQIVLFTGSSEKLAISYASRVALDPLKRFKVLVAVSSLSCGENLNDTRILKCLNKTLFMLKMNVSVTSDTQRVIDEIKEQEGRLDAVGEYKMLHD